MRHAVAIGGSNAKLLLRKNGDRLRALPPHIMPENLPTISALVSNNRVFSHSHSFRIPSHDY
jgi:hypothetical protein